MPIENSTLYFTQPVEEVDVFAGDHEGHSDRNDGYSRNEEAPHLREEDFRGISSQDENGVEALSSEIAKSGGGGEEELVTAFPENPNSLPGNCFI